VKRLISMAITVAVAMAVWIPTASAAAFTGLVSPTIFGGLADLNGSGTITSADSWTAFYGDTDVIGGALDCDAWTAPNDGADGDGLINGDDDCTLIGVDGTADGVTITVTDGHFVEADGVLIPNGFRLPAVFNASDPDNSSVVASDFAWQVLDGRVDANGNSIIDAGDCSVSIVNGWNILGPECGFNPPTALADAGLIDVNGDFVITAADDSASGFFGLAVVDGFVQAPVGGGGGGGGGGLVTISPTGGPVGTLVTITGSGLTGATVTVCGITAAIQSATDTSLTFLVPNVATGTCPVVITTAAQTLQTAFNVTTGEIQFARSVTLQTPRHRAGGLLLRGTVESVESQCFVGVPVKLQRKRPGIGWRNVGGDLTNIEGRYREIVRDRPGRYRAVAPRLEVPKGTCLRAVSNRVRHRH
jgi:hypothetical protein